MFNSFMVQIITLDIGAAVESEPTEFNTLLILFQTGGVSDKSPAHPKSAECAERGPRIHEYRFKLFLDTFCLFAYTIL